MTSSFIISLDFELMWGVRDHRSIADYGDAVLGARQAIPRMVALFEDYGIGASWATVGLLFARNQREMLDFAPDLRPSYAKSALDPYPQIRELAGMDETSAPHWFGRSLLDRIMQSPLQEVACHTFSHYYGLEDGQTVEQFTADLTANLAIARNAGADPRSIVFCRNQFADPYIDAVVACGLHAFRGNQGGYMYRSRAGKGNTVLVRGLRLADGALPLAAPTHFADTPIYHGAVNIPASRFLRPWSPRAQLYNALHVRRIKGEMTRAARDGAHYHLWWHPHNMGRHMDGNFAQLTQILDHYRMLNATYGMQSATMASLAATKLAHG